MEPVNECENWEYDEGIPPFENEYVQQYLRSKEALISAENRLQHDSEFRRMLSPAAEKASRIVARVGERELKEVWTGDASLCDKRRMESTDLWKIVQRMPKGALLHGNLGALVNLDLLVEQALDSKRLHIASSTPMSTNVERRTSPISFRHMPSSRAEVKASPNFWDARYKPMTFLPVRQVAEVFPHWGIEGFKEWLKSRCGTVPETVSNSSCGAGDIGLPVQRALPIIDSILYHEPVFRRCLGPILAAIHDDGIMYAEFRVVFDFHSGRDGSGRVKPDYLTFFRMFCEELKSYKSSPAGTGFMGARVIWTVNRSHSNRQIVESMKLCIEAKDKFPSLIAGIDLMGYGKDARPLAELIPILFWFKKRCFEEDLKIPYLFHVGSCVGDSADVDQNLYEAVLQNSRRICNAFSLYKHPLLIQHIKKKQILVECCPGWNEPLHPNPSNAFHPLPTLMSWGVPVSLGGVSASTDRGGSSELTNIFCWVLNALQTMDLSGLAAMAENSIRWGCIDDQDNVEWDKGIAEGVAGAGVKAICLQHWNADFERFCRWVVFEFGTDEDKG